MSYAINFFSQIYGKGDKKLVFLHGLMGYGSNWRTVAKEFEADYEVLVYDQRGHGRSFKPKTGYAPENYAEDLVKILDELKWPKIYLMGHSMGGRSALNFATRFPERVEKLVIEDIGPERSPKGENEIKELLALVPVPFMSKELARKFFQNEFIKLYKGPENARTLGLFLYSNLAEQNLDGQAGGSFNWRFYLPGILESVKLGRAIDRWTEVAGLKIPTLLIRGENSKELSPEVYQKVLSMNNNIKGVVIPGAGHWVHADQPQKIAAAVKDFFKT
ncbi:MAG: alpha/beta hydrolase [Pseudomonadota bacterium]|nr:alpha/beta hydrolase [Pseudomonadota bacterium]